MSTLEDRVFIEYSMLMCGTYTHTHNKNNKVCTYINEIETNNQHRRLCSKRKQTRRESEEKKKIPTFFTRTLTMHTDHGEVVIRWIAGVGATLSLLGSVVIVASTLLFRDFFRALAWRLIFFLSVADGIASLAYIIHMTTLDRYDAVCVVEAFLMNSFELSSVLWSSAICCHLLLSVVVSPKRIARMELLYHVVAWMLPLIWTAILLSHGRLGRTSNWCWLIPDNIVFGYRFFTFLPIFVSLVFNVTCYIGVCIALRVMVNRSSRWRAVLRDRGARREMRALLRLSMFTVAFFICWVPPFANRLSELLGYDLIYLEYAQAVVNPLLGFINVIVYGLTTPRFFARYRMLLSCKRRHRVTDYDAYGDEAIIDEDMDGYKRRKRMRWRFFRCLCCIRATDDSVSVLYDSEEDGDDGVDHHKSQYIRWQNSGQYHTTPRAVKTDQSQQLRPQPSLLSPPTSPGLLQRPHEHSVVDNYPAFYVTDNYYFDSDSHDDSQEYLSIYSAASSVHGISAETYRTNPHLYSPNTFQSTYHHSGGASVMHNILRHGRGELNSFIDGKSVGLGGASTMGTFIDDHQGYI